MASRRIYRNFTKGTMNKQLDERLVPDGQYIDALNVRIDATESANASVVKPVTGNTQLFALRSTDGVELNPATTTCVGSASDKETGYIYWMIHCSNYNGNKLDMIVGIDARRTNDVKYIVSSEHAAKTALNFSPSRKITAINIIDGTMYFTDGINQPKQIILNRTYHDAITESDLLVIKAPPVNAPSVTPIMTNATESFMSNKVYCFAYRYKYANGQYSATSQFSLPSIYPGEFDMDNDDSTNAGMVNLASGVTIKYNSGPSTVTDIELLFKHADSSDIFVITKLNKRKLGIVDNTLNEFDFKEDRYVSVLPEYEISRLYDNVPIKAVAQTYIGSRLMYGNYSDGFDLIDKNGNPVNVDFSAKAVSTSLERTGGYTKGVGSYSIFGVKSVNDSVLNIDFSGIRLVPGTIIIVNAKLTLDSVVMQPETSNVLANITDVDVAYSIVVKGTYNSVYEFAVSDEFKNAIGTSANINIDLSKNVEGTFTDAVTSAMPMTRANTIGTIFTKYAAGIEAEKTPAKIIAVDGSSVIGIQIPAIVYNYTTSYGYVYFKISSANVIISDVSYQNSLHSNRSYQVGIVYMDEYGRSTPAILSNSSSFFIDASNASKRNRIQVTIPTNQLAPEWAYRYKFAIKESDGNYETIFSNFFFKDPSSKFAYFLLSGENARKVTEDVNLIVKADSYGPATKLIEAKVLSKETLTEGELFADAPAGTYMKLSAENLNITNSDVFTNGKISDVTNPTFADLGSYIYVPTVKYPVYKGTESVVIPEGSVVKISIESSRIGTGSCEKRTYSFSKTIIASRSYDDFMRFWEGEGIATLLDTGTSFVGDVESPELKNVYYPGMQTSTGYRAYTRAEVASLLATWRGQNEVGNNFYYFVTDDGLLSLEANGVKMCNGIFGEDSRKSSISVDIQMYLTGSYLFIFETEPTQQDIDVFYESSQSFAIDKATGHHYGNEANQTASNAAVVILNDFNCICFGNGVESFKIRDSLVGRRFYLGSRALSTTYTDVKRAYRFADITYSGVFNDETNVDKLNQFTLGQRNYKHLEEAFGSIQVLAGRKTDVLVIQENKVSYVLTGKNLLSDSTEGGQVASVPEVLGTQIARVEDYGTTNPESYSSYGPSHMFVDQRRGSVLRIDGMSYQNDTMSVVSNLDMRSWFKDELTTAENTVILTEYDPANDEFIVALTGVEKEREEVIGECGSTEIVTIEANEVFSKNYTIAKGFGTVDVSVRVKTNEIGMVSVLCTGMSEPTLFGDDTSDTITLSISNPTLGEINVSIAGTEPDTEAEIFLEVGCLTPVELTVVQYAITSNSDAGKTANVGYSYESGGYQSKVNSSVFVVSAHQEVYPLSFQKTLTGPIGNVTIPVPASLLKIKIDGVNTDNGIRWSNLNSVRILEGTTNKSIRDLIGSDNVVVMSAGDDGALYGEIQLTNPTATKIHILYDMRKITGINAKQSSLKYGDACCGMPSPSPVYINDSSLSYATAISSRYDSAGLNPYESGFFSDLTTAVRIENSLIVSREICPLCSLLCGNTYIFDYISEAGIYRIPINTKGIVGMMRIRINFLPASPWAIGARVIDENGKIYSTIHAVIYGAHSSSEYGNPVFFGKHYDACSNSGTYTLPVFEYSAGSVKNTGATRTFTVLEDDISTHTEPETFGYTFLVPNLNSKDSRVILELYAMCVGLEIQVDPFCAYLLPEIATKMTTSVTPCDVVQLDETRYIAKRGATIAVGDVLFEDMYGSTYTPQGTYRYANGYVTIGGSGHILTITACTAIPTIIGFQSSSKPVSRIGACDERFDTTYYEDGGNGVVSVNDIIYTNQSKTETIGAAGVYKYLNGYIVVDEMSKVTFVASQCDQPLLSIRGTRVCSTRFQALSETNYGTLYFDDTEILVGVIMYLDSRGATTLASAQGAGYVYLPDSRRLITINSDSEVTSIEIINFEEL